jgi:hypothetical protein
LSGADRRKRRNKDQSRKHKQKRRRLEKESGQSGPDAREKAYLKYASDARVVFGSASTADANVTRSGYTAINRSAEEIAKATLDALVEKGYKVVEWDGRYS